MKVTLQTWLGLAFKGFLAVLFALLMWSIWIAVRPGIDSAPVASVTAARENWFSFGLDRITALQHAPLGNIPLWQYVASLVYTFLAFLLARLIDSFIGHRARQWAAKTASKLDDLLLDLIRGPLKVVVFIVLLHFGLEMYAWPPTLASLFAKAIEIIVAICITYVALNAIDLLVGVWERRTTTSDNDPFSKDLLPLIRKSLKVFALVVAVLVTSQNLGFNVTGLIASLSIGGLALGLAAQDTLGNLFGAVAVFADKPFRVGDRVKIGDVDGVVESIGFRSTRIRNLDGHLVTIPNKTVGNATITNIAMRPNIRTQMNLGLTYDTPPARVKRATEILEEIYRRQPMTQDVWISFNRFSDSSLNIQVVHWWANTDYKAYLAGMQQTNLAIKERFDAEGIEFAFPSHYMSQDAMPRRLAPQTPDSTEPDGPDLTEPRARNI